MNRCLLIAALSTVTACVAPETLVEVDGTPVRSKFITDGTVYNGHPHVGMLRLGSSLCTATLIGKRTVLTAAHCVRVGQRHAFVAGGQTFEAARVIPHPNYSNRSLTNDIAVVILNAAPPLTPARIVRTPPAVGQGVTLIGFGVTSERSRDSGIKRIARNTIASVTSTRIAFRGSGNGTGNTCYGDSGGPAFSTIAGQEVIVGVTSSGTRPCGNDGFDTRVDAFGGWITQVAGGDVFKEGDAAPSNPGGATPPAPPAKDTVLPKVRIDTPKANAVVSSQVVVLATVSDAGGVLGAEVLVDGRIAGDRTAAPYGFKIALSPGRHVITVRGYDRALNRAAASVVVVVPSRTPPPATAPRPPSTPTTPPPSVGTPGLFGAACSRPTDCSSQLCAQAPGRAAKFCTAACYPNGAACPGSTVCLPTTVSGRFVCGPSLPGTQNPRVAGCSVTKDQDASRPTSVLALLALIALGLFWSRRRV